MRHSVRVPLFGASSSISRDPDKTQQFIEDKGRTAVRPLFIVSDVDENY